MVTFKNMKFCVASRNCCTNLFWATLSVNQLHDTLHGATENFLEEG